MQRLAVLLLALCLMGAVQAYPQDSHYTEAGFFDIHVCNRQENPHFIMALFSSERFDDVAQVSVYTPDGTLLGNLNLDKFHAFKSKSGKDKRAFIEYFGMPIRNADGWYRADILMKDGRRYAARDFVVDAFMPMPTELQPAPGAQDVPMPTELRWDPVPGARYYQIYLRDKWNDELILKTDMIREPFLKLPAGLLQPGGMYGWTIHAQDVNEHILLGDFNHGTTTPEYIFTVIEQ